MTLTPEDRLVLALARAQPDEQALASARSLLAGPLDWKGLLATSVRHGVAPLVHRALQLCVTEHREEDPVPVAWRATLGRLAAISEQRNARLFGVTADILAALQARNVQVLGLKDLGLAAEVYPEPGLRPLGDLDLLIRRADYSMAAAAMAELGFRPLPRAEIPYTLRYAWAHHFQRATDNVWVDLQWGVMQREWTEPGLGRAFDAEALWRDTRTVQLPGTGQRLLVSSPEATMFHLCSHLEGHEYGELVLFSDIAAALERWGEALDWDAIAVLAKRYSAQATMYNVLLLARTLVGARVADDALALFAPDVFRAGVFGAIFGGLNLLHDTLDEIPCVTAAPPATMRRLERDVRAQAARARALYDELDEIVEAYSARDGRLMVLEGEGQARRFPDRALPAFGEVWLLVAADERERLSAAFAACGWRSGRDGTLARVVDVTVAEPALAGTRLQLPLDAIPTAGVRDLLGRISGQLSNRDAALRSLQLRLRGGRTFESRARLRFAALEPEELLMWLLVRLGQTEHDVLFRLPPLFDLLRMCSDPVDADRVVERAAGLGAAGALARGISIAAELAGDDPRLAELRAALGGPPPVVRALEWARTGPQEIERYTGLRGPYLYALCLLTPERTERLALLRAGLTRHDGRPPPLFRLAKSTLRGLRTLRRRRRLSEEELVYWLEA